ncbi:MAG: hypothetical protein H6868_03075 [Rhodospirillales bacterium]|nr:hypothetical protein [Rhodospirillales bacterium]
MGHNILEELQLTHYRINSEAELKQALNTGLNSLYQEIFAAPPYEEQFSQDEVDEIFLEYFRSKGIILVAANQEGRPVAFVASVPLTSDFNLVAVAKDTLDIHKSAYFAEDGVDIELRKKGISNEMKSRLLTACRDEGFEAILLRTSIYNYKQISAVNKACGTVISGLFQSVTSRRSDGRMTTDTRSFYNFDLTSHPTPGQTQKLDRVTIVRPGGNDTAIVWDNIPRDQQGDLSKKIQDTYPGIEQVMFVEDGKDGLVRGQMAGGEFCGNATRSLGYLVREGKDGETLLEISGATKPLSVVIQNGMSQTALPVKDSLDSAQPYGEDYMVHLDGISFIITDKNHTLGRRIMSETDLDTQKSIVIDALRDGHLMDEQPASGVMVVDMQDDGSYKLEPFVFVRNTGTLYYETGCGSGSTSVGVMVAKKTSQPVNNLRIKQPSGMDLLVSIQRTNDRFEGATVNGPIEVLFDGTMYISSPRQRHEHASNPKAKCI